MTTTTTEVPALVQASVSRFVAFLEIGATEGLFAPDVFVDIETGVNTAISKVRQALRDPAGHPEYVETVAGRGYRFIAPLDGPLPPGPAADGPAPGAPPIAAPSEPGVPLSHLGQFGGIVNQDGIVFQRDFGADTEARVAAMEAFDADRNWKKVE